MIKNVNNEIMAWKGIENKYVTKPKKSFNEYKITARNWFNRNKAKMYGNHVFYPMFMVILKVTFTLLPVMWFRVVFVNIFVVCYLVVLQ